MNPPKRLSNHMPIYLLAVTVCGLHIFFPVLWFLSAAQGGVALERDWYQLWWAGLQFREGQLEHLYTVSPDAKYFWRYPPYALWLVWPLSLFTPKSAYILLCTFQAICLFGATVLLTRTLHLGKVTGLVFAGILCASPATSTLILAQSSGLMLLLLAGSIVAMQRRHPVRMAILLGLFALKPNWGIFFGLFAIGTRRWNTAAQMIVVVILFIATTLPMGPEVWQDFFSSSLSNPSILTHYEAYKQITLQGFLHAVLPPQLATWVWRVSAVVFLGLAFWIWHHLRRTQRLPHALGIAVLVAICVNPYASFYDAILIAIPACLWWHGRHQYPAKIRMLIGCLIGVMWLWEYYTLYYVQQLQLLEISAPRPFSIVGPSVALWLILEAYALHIRRNTSTLRRVS